MSAKRRAWDAANPGNGAIRAEVTAAALAAAAEAVGGDGDLLDAGCGGGWWLRRLEAEGVAAARLYGVDVVAHRVRTAARRAPGATLTVGDVRALPYGDERFAAVFALTVLSSLPSGGAVDAAIRECWRVLAPGGVLVVWEPRVPTANPRTRLIRRRDLAAVTGVRPSGRSLTLLPPLARRLGPATERWYPRLARIPPLRSHRLHVLRQPVDSLPGRQ